MYLCKTITSSHNPLACTEVTFVRISKIPKCSLGFISLWGNCRSPFICGLSWSESFENIVGFFQRNIYQNQHVWQKPNQNTIKQWKRIFPWTSSSQRSLAQQMAQLQCCSSVTIASEWLLFYFILSWLVPGLNCFQTNKTLSICVFASVGKILLTVIN